MKIDITSLLLHSKQFVRLEQYAKDKNLDLDFVLYHYSHFIANVYLNMIKKSIQTQKIGNTPMKLLYKPLSPKYKKRKNPKHRKDFWINTGTLMSLFRVWKYRHWYVGIPKYIKYKNKKVKASDIIDFLEYGTKYIPARPLFSKNLKLLIKKMPKLTETFIPLFETKILKNNK